MRTITASQARQGFAELLDAVRDEPVFVQRQKRDVAVVMSVEEYQRLVHLNVAEFQRFCDQVGQSAKEAGMTQEILDDLLSDDA